MILLLGQITWAQSELIELPDFIEHQVIDIHVLKTIFHEQKNYQAERSTGIICWGTGTYLNSDSLKNPIYWTLDVVEGKINFVFNFPLDIIDAKYFATLKKSPWTLKVDDRETTIHFEVSNTLTNKGTIGDFGQIWKKSSQELLTLRFLKNLEVKTIFDQEKPKPDPRLKKIRYLPNGGFILNKLK